MNFDFTNNKNSTDINLGACTVNVLCQLEIKYCVVKVFVFSCILSIIHKNPLLQDMFYELFLLS